MKKKSVAFEVSIKDHEYEDVSEILRNDDDTFVIYVGNEKIAKDAEKLKELKIGHIIQATYGNPPHGDQFKYCLVKISDTPMQGIMNHFPRTNKFIDEAMEDDSSVLIHCTQGVSRSSTICMAFIMYKFGWSAKKSIAYVQKKRKIAKPNKGFIYQLKEYEKELKKKDE